MLRTRLVLVLPVFQFILVSCRAQEVMGCTDIAASNYNSKATINDGSCLYDPVTITPTYSVLLSENVKETSGLIFWEDYVWTHNDNEDTNLYSLNLETGEINDVIHLNNVENIDWEEIGQDKDFIYIGDFGNNKAGNRQDLHILRIAKASIHNTVQQIDTIWFRYEDQTDFDVRPGNNTDFDCEAFLVLEDSIFLFTKEWLSLGTTVYGLPKEPGSFVAKKKYGFNVNGLITGGTFLEEKKAVVLCGYTGLLVPFLYLLYDFSGTDFFSGNKRKIDLDLAQQQVEGITHTLDNALFLSNEGYSLSQIIDSPQMLSKFDLGNLIDNQTAMHHVFTNDSCSISFYPNPAQDWLTILNLKSQQGIDFILCDMNSDLLRTGQVHSSKCLIYIGDLLPGTYIIRFFGNFKGSFRFIKL